MDGKAREIFVKVLRLEHVVVVIRVKVRIETSLTWKNSINGTHW